VFAQWDFPLHYKNKRYVPPIKFVENQNNLGNTNVTHGMTLYRKGKCLGANSLLLHECHYNRPNHLLEKNKVAIMAKIGNFCTGRK
jgi:hypothetical protein